MYEAYREFIDHLQDREYFGQKLGLERITEILGRLGNPQNAFLSIHVAGTNGKGSTVMMLATILKHAGYRVGIYTSPHLEDFCERIRIGEDLIHPDDVVRWLNEIKKVETEPLTFFELATVMAFLFFAEKKIDFAVVETGLGGRLDATNVLLPMISVITSIGLDHQQFLGDTRAHIAFEKAGIIKEGRDVVAGPLSKEALEVVKRVATEKKSELFHVADDLLPGTWKVGLAGAHQRVNASIAVQTLRRLIEKGQMNVSEEAMRIGLESVRWPGRLETIQKDPWILLDGAHNEESMRVLCDYLAREKGSRTLKVVFGAMRDKDIDSLLSLLSPLTQGEILFVRPNLKRAASLEELEKFKYFSASRSAESLAQALEMILPTLSRNDVLLVTGSLFLVGEARAWFRKKAFFS